MVNTQGRESGGSWFETCSGVWYPRRRPCGVAINTLVDLINWLGKPQALICLFLSLAISVCLFVCLFLSLPPSISIYVSLYLFLSSLCLPLSLPPSFSSLPHLSLSLPLTPSRSKRARDAGPGNPPPAGSGGARRRRRRREDCGRRGRRSRRGRGGPPPSRSPSPRWRLRPGGPGRAGTARVTRRPRGRGRRWRLLPPVM